MTDQELYHHQAIEEIWRRARQQAQPHIDQLVKIRSLKPMEPMILPLDSNGHIVLPKALSDSDHLK